MSSCVCKILFKSEQICGCCSKMLRVSLFWDTRYSAYKFKRVTMQGVVGFIKTTLLQVYQ